MKTRHRAIPLLALLLALSAVAAERQGIAARVSQQRLAIELDGRLDDVAWNDAPLNSRFFQFQPEDGRDAPEHLRTTVKVLVDLLKLKAQ